MAAKSDDSSESDNEERVIVKLQLSCARLLKMSYQIAITSMEFLPTEEPDPEWDGIIAIFNVDLTPEAKEVILHVLRLSFEESSLRQLIDNPNEYFKLSIEPEEESRKQQLYVFGHSSTKLRCYLMPANGRTADAFYVPICELYDEEVYADVEMMKDQQ